MQSPESQSSQAAEGPSRPPLPKPDSGARAKRHFVAEADRRRASRACDGCRRTKEKCEGGVPCNRCVRTKRPCHFSPTSSYDVVRTTKGGNAAASAGQAERVKHLEQIALHFLGKVSLDLSSLRRISDTLNLEKPSATGDDGLTPEDLEDLDLEDEAYTVKTLSENVAHYSGEFSHWNFSERILKRVDESLGADDGEVRSPIVEYYRPTQLQSPCSTIISIADSLPPAEVAEFLLQMFFRYADPCYFYVEESWVRAHLAVLQDRSATISSDDSAWVCAVLMVLAVGAQYAHVASGPLPDSNASSVGTPGEAPPQPELEFGVSFYHIASKLLPDVIAIASLESVQACLLLGAYTLTLDTQGIAYTYVGLAVKLAIQNGLHRRYSGRELDPHTVELRNRLWWTVWSLEKRICVLHGRPGTVVIADIDAELPVEHEAFDNPDSSRFPNIAAMIYLTVRLGDISHAITLLRRCPKRQQPTFFDRLMDIRTQLQRWWGNQPISESNTDLLTPDPLFRSNIHLKLSYHLNQIFMGRPFIFASSVKSPPRSESGAASSPNPSEVQRSSKVSLLIHDAVAAGLAIVELCAILDKQEGLARASYIEFSSCRAALLLLLAQSLNERTAALRLAIDTGIRLLRRCTAGNVSHQSDVSIIEALDNGVRMLHADQDAATGVRRSESGYERFRSWANLWKGGVGTGGYDADVGGASSSGPNPVKLEPSSVLPGITTASAAGGTDAHMAGLDFSSFSLNPAFDFNAPIMPVAGLSGVGNSSSNSNSNMAFQPPATIADFSVGGVFSPSQFLNGAESLDDEWQWNPASFEALDAALFAPPPGQPPRCPPA